MNKFSIIFKSIIVAISIVGITYANDNSSDHSLLKSWTGFYTGMEAGFAFNNDQLNSQQLGFTNPSGKCNISSDYSTFSPGIQLGYMYQFPNYLVSGIEANVAFNSHQIDTLRCICPFDRDVADSFSFRNQMQRSIKARIGHALNTNKNILPYLTAGASFANIGFSYKNEGGDYYAQNTTQAGWLIGAGVEWAFKQNWSLRAEYNYVEYGNAINLKIPSVYGLLDPNGLGRINLSSNNVVVSINYWI